MPTRSNEQLCRLAQAGDTAARDILLENNLGFIQKIALEQYRGMGLDENDIGIGVADCRCCISQKFHAASGVKQRDCV